MCACHISFPSYGSGYHWLTHHFGNGEAWCDIRPIEPDCSKYTLGTILRFSLWYGPLCTLCLIMLIAATVVACRIKRDSKQWYTLHDPIYRTESQNAKKRGSPPSLVPHILCHFRHFLHHQWNQRILEPDTHIDTTVVSSCLYITISWCSNCPSLRTRQWYKEKTDLGAAEDRYLPLLQEGWHWWLCCNQLLHWW